MLQLSQVEKRTLGTVARMMIYFFVLTGVIVGIWWLAKIFGADTFDENGIVENVQCFLLSISGLVYSIIAWRHKSIRIVCLGLVSLCILGFCREQDAWFDLHLPVLSWRIGYFFPMCIMLFGIQHFNFLKKQVIEFFQTSAFSLMFCAMVIIIPCAQCIGHRPLIIAVVPNADVGVIHPIRRMIEESGELLGYLLILLAAIELILSIKKR